MNVYETFCRDRDSSQILRMWSIPNAQHNTAQHSILRAGVLVVGSFHMISAKIELGELCCKGSAIKLSRKVSWRWNRKDAPKVQPTTTGVDRFSASSSLCLLSRQQGCHLGTLSYYCLCLLFRLCPDFLDIYSLYLVNSRPSMKHFRLDQRILKNSGIVDRRMNLYTDRHNYIQRADTYRYKEMQSTDRPTCFV
jgi:hypothetical protein